MRIDLPAQKALEAAKSGNRHDAKDALLRAIEFLERDSDLGQMCELLRQGDIPTHNVRPSDVEDAEAAVDAFLMMATKVADGLYDQISCVREEVAA